MMIVIVHCVVFRRARSNNHFQGVLCEWSGMLLNLVKEAINCKFQGKQNK